MAKFYKLLIKEVIKETADAVSIVFDIPQELKDKFSFEAGQYVTLKKEINGEDVRRAYSICSSPSSGELKVAVKAVENGKFSTYATTQLNNGDQLEVSEPEGKFILEPETGKNYIGIAAGSGITPVLSMVKATLEDSSANFTLVYGNKSKVDTIFYNELNDLSNKYAERLKVHYVFSRERDDNALFGRIDKGHVNYFIKNTYKGIQFNQAFLCGPEEMITIASETLLENGLSKDAVNYELFTASTSEENTSQVKEGETEITVLVDDEETTFTMKQSDTILAAGLRNKLDVPYSCQGGVCSSCIAKVTKGKAIMTKNSILTDDELEEGLVLTCVAHPTTEQISVDYDEV
ncbi:ring-1,2-phenylacetyl-CoA epoxidase subunit PaaE [Tenacibaculum sp. MAR_2009_124]|uniref:ferredoxin--NADP reductase n=1 Tax=Tenacibaculum sp. MAR_2009_124 TaxID=1250059 RepID=UPI00089A1970|nr:ferredoxin--NADP reductase [Tenacibaculum sp. MAR_2009_124]SEC34941.1 ring-1,2-phenylacetyl-CoA epoxidase subunit PaaE [Tenacibaculum sp. MAR_2009_124]